MHTLYSIIEFDLLVMIITSRLSIRTWKNDNFATLQWLSPNEEELDGGGARLHNKRRLFITFGMLSRGGDLSPGGSSSS
ncbi:unnamed protein product [Spirodela intermedia]|uniref:Uncharacterized protein n=1 Tax=Spirodela intermedia TaxID=51605 RepID=A0A7I8JPC1_SPIIN|nr:unnamed protein product [Spirodela intermedia]CAA6672006.1 unnamed protein product [Spirodela intermedia]